MCTCTGTNYYSIVSSIFFRFNFTSTVNFTGHFTKDEVEMSLVVKVKYILEYKISFPLRIDVDECNPISPCQNGGSCANKPGSYQCQCLSGFQGNDCENGKSKLT